MTDFASVFCAEFFLSLSAIRGTTGNSLRVLQAFAQRVRECHLARCNCCARGKACPFSGGTSVFAALLRRVACRTLRSAHTNSLANWCCILYSLYFSDSFLCTYTVFLDKLNFNLFEQVTHVLYVETIMTWISLAQRRGCYENREMTVHSALSPCLRVSMHYSWVTMTWRRICNVPNLFHLIWLLELRQFRLIKKGESDSFGSF